jgi:hypothetical protein
MTDRQNDTPVTTFGVVTGVFYSLTFDCGDYYCDGMHLVGIFDTEETAAQVRDMFKANAAEWFPALKSRGDEPQKWEYSIAPFTLGKVYDGDG